MEDADQKIRSDAKRAVLALELALAQAKPGTRVGCHVGAFGNDVERFDEAAREAGIESFAVVGNARRIKLGLRGRAPELEIVDIDDASGFDALAVIGSNAGVAPLLGTEMRGGFTLFGEPYLYSGWEDACRYAACLSEGGKAVFALPTRFLGTACDAAVRAHLLEQGLIEAVVELGRVDGFFVTGDEVSLLVLSANNKAVALVDATGAEYGAVCGLLEQALRVPVGTIAQSGAILTPGLWKGGACTRRYVPLGELATKISRGTTLKSGEIAQQPSWCPGEEVICYIAVGDLDEAVLGELGLGDVRTIMGDVPQNQRRYLVQPGDIVINKMRPFSCAVLRERFEGDLGLPSGNLFAVQLDRARIDPQFAQAYLMSEDGYAQIMRAAFEHATPSLTKADLEQVMVAVDTLDEQQRVVERLKDLRVEQEQLESRLARIKAEAKSAVR